MARPFFSVFHFGGFFHHHHKGNRKSDLATWDYSCSRAWLYMHCYIASQLAIYIYIYGQLAKFQGKPRRKPTKILILESFGIANYMVAAIMTLYALASALATMHVRRHTYTELSKLHHIMHYIAVYKHIAINVGCVITITASSIQTSNGAIYSYMPTLIANYIYNHSYMQLIHGMVEFGQLCMCAGIIKTYTCSNLLNKTQAITSTTLHVFRYSCSTASYIRIGIYCMRNSQVHTD